MAVLGHPVAARVAGCHRPASVQAALADLQRPGAVIVGGGTRLNACRPSGTIEVVDLQALALDLIHVALDGRVEIGATVRLERLATSELVPEAVREAARREVPSTLRAQATVGGCVATGDWESELLATLLVHDAVVQTACASGLRDQTLEAVLADLPIPAATIITAVSITTGGVTSAARTGRTRGDRPIVAAVARLTPDGDRRLALTGVAPIPLLLDADRRIEPPADFRGSSEYRRALAEILIKRALKAVG